VREVNFDEDEDDSDKVGRMFTAEKHDAATAMATTKTQAAPGIFTGTSAASYEDIAEKCVYLVILD
jgi:hypothetical protein